MTLPNYNLMLSLNEIKQHQKHYLPSHIMLSYQHIGLAIFFSVFFTTLLISYIYSKKKRGARTLHCGLDLITLCILEV